MVVFVEAYELFVDQTRSNTEKKSTSLFTRKYKTFNLSL
jgi:hypothetical protein